MSHIELNIIADSPADLSDAIAKLFAQFNAVEKPSAAEVLYPPKPEPETAKRGRKAKVDEKIAITGEEHMHEEPVVEATQDVEPEPTVAYSDVQAAVTKLAAAKGRTAVMNVFEQFGVDHGNKLTEAQWPEAIAALGDALAEEVLA